MAQFSPEKLPECWLEQAWQQDLTAPVPLASPDLLPGLQVLAPRLVDSTNALLWELWHQGTAPPLTAIAREQTAGRGQWGRRWQSSPGGLYLSLLLQLDLPVDRAAHLILLSAWGLAYAFNQHRIPVGLKWPNDLLLGGKKLGGIKTETKIHQGRMLAGVIGVGINWANEVPHPGICLKSYCEHQGLTSITGLTSLAEITLAGLTLGWQRYQRGGIDSILAGYLEFFSHRGQTVELDQGPAFIESVTREGNLLVTVNGQRQCLSPGTISLGYSNYPAIDHAHHSDCGR